MQTACKARCVQLADRWEGDLAACGCGEKQGPTVCHTEPDPSRGTHDKEAQG